MTVTTTNRPQPTIENFRYENHGAGAAAIAAKKISEGQTVSFDLWANVKDDAGFLTVKREYQKTVYFGLLDLKEEIEGRSIALRISNSNDLDECGSSSLIPSWTPSHITTDAVYIAAELMHYLSRFDNAFINQ